MKAIRKCKQHERPCCSTVRLRVWLPDRQKHQWISKLLNKSLAKPIQMVML